MVILSVLIIAAFIIGLIIGRYIISHGLIRENTLLESQLSDYKALYQKLDEQFKQIADKALIQNSNQFASSIESTLKLKHDQINNTIAPIASQMKEIDSYLAKFNTFTTTKFEQHMTTLLKETQTVANKAEQLSLTLKGNNKEIGSWGEWTLENLFTTLGMQEHIDYDKQFGLKEQSGIPDFIVNLAGKKLVIDVKSPSNNYLDDDITKKKFLDNLKININNVAKKNYTLGSEYFDYLIIYLPLDGMLLTASNLDPELIKSALNKKIILTTPSTIYPIIATLRYILDNYEIVKNVENAITIIKDIYGYIQESGDKLRISINRLEESRDAYNKIIPSISKLGDLGFMKDSSKVAKQIIAQ